MWCCECRRHHRAGSGSVEAAAPSILKMFRDISSPAWFMHSIERAFPCDSVCDGLAVALVDPRLVGISAVRLHVRACPRGCGVHVCVFVCACVRVCMCVHIFVW